MRFVSKRNRRLAESIDKLVVELEDRKAKTKSIAQFCTNQADQSFLFDESVIDEHLIRLYDLRINLRGSPDDYIEAATFHTDLANSKDDKDAITHYTEAIRLIEKIPSHMRNFEFYECALSIYLEAFKLYEINEIDANQTLLITKSLDYADQAILIWKDSRDENLNPYTKHDIAEVFISYSQSIQNLDKKDKINYLRKGIRLLREVMEVDSNADTHYSYGEAHYLLSLEINEPMDKQAILCVAVDNLKKSYEQDNNPQAKELLNDIEQQK